MDFKDIIDKEPMIMMDDAFNIILYATIIQHGMNYPDNLNDAQERIRGHLLHLTLSQNAITKKYIDSNLGSVDDDYIEEYGVDTSRSLVNVKELLYVYNADRKANGAPPTKISRWVHTTGTVTSDITTSSRSILDLVSAIARIVKEAITREEKLKAGIFESIFDECLVQIQDKTIQSLLPEIKKNILENIEHKMSDGNISKITDKKIEATIFLTEKYDKQNVTLNSKLELIKSLKDSNLLKADKEHVVNTFIALKTR
ncbi:MAG: hypothetical protein H7X86_00760 [Gorillibacterium sp.]|nr:hypothetical protein [Gorillibacterium sp.]